nr:threonine dehydratase biosynthetic, chloroplastic-like [Ipomoea batatas]
MDVVCFSLAQSPYLHPKSSPATSAIPSKSTVKTAGVRRTSRAVLFRAAAAVAPEVLVDTSTSTDTRPSCPPPPPAELPRVSPSSLQCDPGYLIPNPSLQASNGAGRDNAVEYLTSILASKVYDVAYESPLQLAPKLSERLANNVWLKREDLQPVFSFKLRGAYNMMAKLPKEQLERGVICSSAGNHAQGVALSAQRLGCNAVIVMPVTTPEIKWQSVEGFGATVVLVGDSYDEAQAYAKNRAEEEGRSFIPPFDHPDVIAGQGTVGKEIMNQINGPVHAIFVPVGGGGLIAGIAAYVKMLGFADGVAVKVVGEETYRICRETIDGVVLVSRDAICASIKDMFEEKRSILEPAGALALAGAEAYCKHYGHKNQNVVVITSGANMNFDRLRLVTELADIGRQQEAVLATYMPDDPGSFKQFCELVGPMNITEFKCRCTSSKEKAVALYRQELFDLIVGLHLKIELEAMMERMSSAGLYTINLTNNDLVKDHLRHLMGGRSNVQNELLCRFVFPERPGALMKFLDAFSPRWNISLFHYRSQGEEGANVLVGIQVADSEIGEFKDCAHNLGYEYAVENSNRAFQLLMH